MAPRTLHVQVKLGGPGSGTLGWGGAGRGRGWRGRLGLLGGAAVLALLVWLPFSGHLVVREVEVVGNQYLPSERVALEAGVSPGMPLIDLKAERVRLSLLRDPWIREATVGRGLSGRVVLRVVEREPVLRVEGGDFLSDDGFLLPRLPGAAFPSLPLLRWGGSLPPPGGMVEDPALRAAVELSAGMGPWLREAAREVKVEGPERISVLAKEGWEAVLGGPDGLEAKERSLRQVLQFLKERGEVPVYIDVRAPQYPSYRLAR